MSNLFIRVRSKVTGHEFDIFEQQFDELKHVRVDKRRYPPVKRPRRTKFRAPIAGGFSISPAVSSGVDVPAVPEKEVGHVDGDS